MAHEKEMRIAKTGIPVTETDLKAISGAESPNGWVRLKQGVCGLALELKMWSDFELADVLYGHPSDSRTGI